MNKKGHGQKNPVAKRRRRCIVTSVMPPSATKVLRAAKSGAGAFCLGAFLLVQFMAAVPDFHAWVHHDAGNPNHECAVTLFLHGQVHGSSTAVEASPCPAVLVSHAAARGVDFVSIDVRLLPGRGPPA
jgi:hypothetical protein